MQRGISVLAFFVPAFIMLVLFIIRGIYPFGDRSFLFSDMYHQYMPFLSEFVHKIKAGEGLFYSYNVGIGSNFLALYVYYLASPFNWLVFLLPEGLIMEFMSYLVILRIGLMGLTFSIYLRKVFGKEDPAALLFSTAYALSGYLAAYNWNVMWLDCLILLPLILLGAERLVREGKWVMYTVALGLCILTNYYISIMICIFLVLYFGMLLITEYYTMTEGQSRKARIVFGRIGRFAFASLLAGGLAAALLIPEVCAILRTDFGNSDFPGTLESYFSVFDMLARHCLCVTTERGLIDPAELLNTLHEYRDMIAPFVCDVSAFLDKALKEGKTILLEGQLGTMKDPDHGIYPMVTSSSTLAAYGAIGAGIPPYEIKQIVTVSKAYSSSVGAGAFVSEIFGDEADELRRRGGDGGEFGATTGRPRRMGWFDCVATKYGCRLQGATDVAFTVLDALGYLDEIPVCVGYEIDGEVTTDFPVTYKLEMAKPVLKKLPGWKCDIRGIRNFDELPENCRKYVEFIEEQIGFPITLVSNGPGREDIIYRESPLKK